MDRDRLAGWLAAHRAELTGAGVWTLGAEVNAEPAAAFETRAVRVLVARLSAYRDVSVSTSHGVVAALLSQGGDVFCDFAYLPPAPDRASLRAAGLPLWFGTTTARPPRDFDVLAVSASAPVEFVNLAHLLVASGLPLAREERLADPAVPLVLLGGAAASHTSVLHGDVDPGRGGLVDAVIVGEAEVAAPALAALLVEARAAGLDKRAILRAAAERVPGFYDPARYRQRFAGTPARLVAVEPTDAQAPFPVRRATLAALDDVPEPPNVPVPYGAADPGTTRLRISFGCAAACTFCAEGWDQKPYRQRSLAALQAALRAAKVAQGAHAVDLYAFNFPDHAAFAEVVEAAAAEFAEVRLRSQRLDRIAREPGLWALQRALGKRQVTAGVEGLSERLRRYLGKRLPDAELYRALAILLADPPGELKLFFIATGRETEADYADFTRLAAELAELVHASRRSVRVIVSLTPLLVHAHTPLAFQGRGIAPAAFAEVKRRLAGIAGRHGIELRAAAGEHELDAAQLLALADRRLTPALVRATVDGAGLYDEDIPRPTAVRLLAELRRDGLDLSDFLFARALTDPCPWDDIAAGAGKAHLFQRFEDALADREGPWCTDDALGPGHCVGCGACPRPEPLRRRPLSAALVHAQATLERLGAARQQPERLHVRLHVPPALRHVPAESWPAIVARALFQVEPRLAPAYLGPDVPPEPLLGPGVAGERRLALRLCRGALGRALALDAALVDRQLPAGVRVLLLAEPPPAPTLLAVHLRSKSPNPE